MKNAGYRVLWWDDSNIGNLSKTNRILFRYFIQKRRGMLLISTSQDASSSTGDDRKMDDAFEGSVPESGGLFSVHPIG